MMCSLQQKRCSDENISPANNKLMKVDDVSSISREKLSLTQDNSKRVQNMCREAVARIKASHDVISNSAGDGDTRASSNDCSSAAELELLAGESVDTGDIDEDALLNDTTESTTSTTPVKILVPATDSHSPQSDVNRLKSRVCELDRNGHATVSTTNGINIHSIDNVISSKCAASNSVHSSVPMTDTNQTTNIKSTSREGVTVGAADVDTQSKTQCATVDDSAIVAEQSGSASSPRATEIVAEQSKSASSPKAIEVLTKQSVSASSPRATEIVVEQSESASSPEACLQTDTAAPNLIQRCDTLHAHTDHEIHAKDSKLNDFTSKVDVPVETDKVRTSPVTGHPHDVITVSAGDSTPVSLDVTTDSVLENNNVDNNGAQHCLAETEERTADVPRASSAQLAAADAVACSDNGTNSEHEKPVDTNESTLSTDVTCKENPEAVADVCKRNPTDDIECKKPADDVVDKPALDNDILCKKIEEDSVKTCTPVLSDAVESTKIESDSEKICSSIPAVDFQTEKIETQSVANCGSATVGVVESKATEDISVETCNSVTTDVVESKRIGETSLEASNSATSDIVESKQIEDKSVEATCSNSVTTDVVDAKKAEEKSTEAHKPSYFNDYDNTCIILDSDDDDDVVPTAAIPMDTTTSPFATTASECKSTNDTNVSLHPDDCKLDSPDPSCSNAVCPTESAVLDSVKRAIQHDVVDLCDSAMETETAEDTSSATDGAICKTSEASKAVEETPEVAARTAETSDAASEEAKATPNHVNSAGVTSCAVREHMTEAVSGAEVTPDAARQAEVTPDVMSHAEATPDAVSQAGMTPNALDRTEATSDATSLARATPDTASLAEATPDATTLAEATPDATSVVEATSHVGSGAEELSSSVDNLSHAKAKDDSNIALPNHARAGDESSVPLPNSGEIMFYDVVDGVSVTSPKPTTPPTGQVLEPNAQQQDVQQDDECMVLETSASAPQQVPEASESASLQSVDDPVSCAGTKRTAPPSTGTDTDVPLKKPRHDALSDTVGRLMDRVGKSSIDDVTSAGVSTEEEEEAEDDEDTAISVTYKVVQEKIKKEFELMCARQKKALEERLNVMKMELHKLVSETSRLDIGLKTSENKASVKAAVAAASAAVDEQKQTQKQEQPQKQEELKPELHPTPSVTAKPPLQTATPRKQAASSSASTSSQHVEDIKNRSNRPGSATKPSKSANKNEPPDDATVVDLTEDDVTPEPSTANQSIAEDVVTPAGNPGQPAKPVVMALYASTSPPTRSPLNGAIRALEPSPPKQTKATARKSTSKKSSVTSETSDTGSRRSPESNQRRSRSSSPDLEITTVTAPVTATQHPAPLPPMPTSQPSRPHMKQLPAKPNLRISRVQQGIVLSWNMAITDDREEIVTYQLYAYQETSEAPAPHLWKKVGDVKALPLPMACTLTQFQVGNIYHFAVRATDKHRRFGPFSDANSIHLAN